MNFTCDYRAYWQFSDASLILQVFNLFLNDTCLIFIDIFFRFFSNVFNKPVDIGSCIAEQFLCHFYSLPS